MNQQQLVEARKTAESAVQDMVEGPIKVKAFEVILSRLLGGAESAPKAEDKTPPSTMTAAKKTETKKAIPKTAAGRIMMLRDDGFFGAQRGLGDIQEELQTRGWIYPVTSLSGPVQSLVQRGMLRRAMVTEGKKKNYRYVNP